MDNIFKKLPALKVQQPLSDFYVVSIAAKDLLEISFSEPLKYVDNSGKVQGSQRPKDLKRLKEIAKYIDSVEMAFPNSIIIAANYAPNGHIVQDKNERWKIVQESGNYFLIIPQSIKLAAIIDGQHRLNAFEYVQNKDRFAGLQLVCSVYFDLPNSYQAFLFATINSNQKRVDRSLALEQFGYNVDDEPEKAWTPEKFAVFLSRKLNLDKDSPFYKHIKVTPLNADVLFEEIEKTWTISTATIVDGICALISGNPKRDRIEMQQATVFQGRNREMIRDIKDISPLRTHFIQYKDKFIYDVIVHYFRSIKEILWNKADEKSYICKTIGVQASFDILKLILVKQDSIENLNFDNYLSSVSSVNFSNNFFQASGIGRSRIRNIIGMANGLLLRDKIKGDILNYYDKILLGDNIEILNEKWYWEEEAEIEVLNTLEKAEWNYDSKSVSLLDNYGFDNIMEYNNFNNFYQKLIEIAESAFCNNLPSDSEFSEEQRDKFNPEDLVNNCLLNYNTNLRKIGWITSLGEN